jgi:hypothetical protein
MNRRLTDALAWLDRRTGIETAVRHFLNDEIPGSSGWRQVFGSVAVFLFDSCRLTEALAWLDRRTGIQTAARHFLDDENPASSGWRQAFGSVAGLLFDSGGLFAGTPFQRENS